MISRDQFLVWLEQCCNSFELVKNGKKKQDAVSYYSVPAAFDIETSSWYENGQKRAAMYIWQFGICNKVTYGRTWTDFVRFIKRVSQILNLSSKTRLCVYVHNLSYEFQFIRRWFKWENVFLLKPRTPVYAVTVDGIEYRCSYKLSSKSLAKTAEELRRSTVKKLVGDLDHTLVRNSKTPLTQKELGYCENDILVLLAYIGEKIEDEGFINIPLTSTGYVRAKCREECFRFYKDYSALMRKLTLEPEEYSMLRECFQGGFSHGNAIHAKKTYENVGSYDFTSSYPAVMLYEKYPMSKGVIVELEEKDIDKWAQNYCLMLDVTFHTMVGKLNHEHILSISHCKKGYHSELTDNGKVVTISNCRTIITEQDYFALRDFYDWDVMKVNKAYAYIKGYLPIPFIRAVMSFYKGKQTLKDIPEKEVEYMVSKGMLNSTYGMTVTDIVRKILEYDTDYLKPRDPDLKEEIKKYNNKKNRFLFYPWGVWITSYARRNLFKAIKTIGVDYLYADTDSVKIRNPDKWKAYMEQYNNQVKDKVLRAAAHFHLTAEDYAPAGKWIGVWEFEGIYRRFKFQHSKCYLVELEDGTLKATIAGASKKGVSSYLASKEKPFDVFSVGMKIPAGLSGRKTHTYIDDMTYGYVTDYLGNTAPYLELSSIHMEEADFTMDMLKEYEKFLHGYVLVKEELF